MKVLYQVRPYERVPGTSDKLFETGWTPAVRMWGGRPDRIPPESYRITNDFQQVEVTEEKESGSAGRRILVKYHLPQITGWRNFWNAPAQS